MDKSKDTDNGKEKAQDKLARLKVLLGEGDVFQAPSQSDAFFIPTPAPKTPYYSTDSEDDEVITSKGQQDGDPSNEEAKHPFEHTIPGDFNPFKEYRLGQLALESEAFCPWQTVKSYPYTFIGAGSRSKVDAEFFAFGKLYERTWDFFYLHRPDAPKQQPILLVPTRQFQHFLAIINRSLNTRLTIPSGGASGRFQVKFENDGTPRPRYLGQSANKEMADSLKNNATPPSSYSPRDEVPSTVAPTDRSLAAFKAKIDLILNAQKGKKLANKEKAKKERIEKQKSWKHSIKRVQRYLGIRDIRRGHRAAIMAKLEGSGLEWAAYDEAVKAELEKLPPSSQFNPDKPISFDQENSVVFVCVDVEAYERNTKLITEIGIATLDTEDIKYLAPGEKGANWMTAIRARHFRINEHKHLNNVEFVHGCADRFEFGESEFINLKDAPRIISSCFKPPFSKPVEPSGNTELVDNVRRNVILVGHNVDADIDFLRKIGYDVLNLGSLLETVDTANMYRYLQRECNFRNLGSILAQLNIVGWNLHNAGNDAVYTLQAMLGIAISHLTERKEEREAELREQVAESVKQAQERALEQQAGWSSGGDDSDGGAPIAPVLSSASKRSPHQPQRLFETRPSFNPSSRDDGLWRPMKQSTGNSLPPADQTDKGSPSIVFGLPDRSKNSVKKHGGEWSAVP